MITKIVHDYVLIECKNSKNLLNETFFKEHILPVCDFSKQLAERIHADHEIVEIASCLHDISAVKDFSTLPLHHTVSADIAAALLRQQNYPEEKILTVSNSIKSHTTPQRVGSCSPEAVCLSNADAMSQITNIPYWLYFAFCIRKLPFEQGRGWLRQKVEANWEALIDPAKKIIENDYETALKSLRKR